ncbi:hypothetical protein Hanom_Chr14g01301801 [Helianthus anomalus]
MASSPVGSPQNDWQKDDDERQYLDGGNGSEKSLDLNGVSKELFSNSYVPVQHDYVGGGPSSKIDGVAIEKGEVEPLVAQSLVDPPIDPVVGVVLEINKDKEGFNDVGINQGSVPQCQ